MKGLFPTAQYGAQQINANNNRSNARSVQRHTYNNSNKEELPILCSRCAESIEDTDIDVKTYVAVGVNFICIFLMLGAASLVTELRPLYPYNSRWDAIATSLCISIALFIACAISHITVAHRMLDMSLSRMVFWSTNLSSAGGILGMLWLRIWFPYLHRGRWLIATNLAMWGWLVALLGVYVAETIRLHGKSRKSKECMETRNEKAAL